MVLILKIVFTIRFQIKELVSVLDNTNLLQSLMMLYVENKEDCTNVLWPNMNLVRIVLNLVPVNVRIFNVKSQLENSVLINNCSEILERLEVVE